MTSSELDTLLHYYDVNGCTYNLDLWLDNATDEQLQRYHDIKEKNEQMPGRDYVRCVINLKEKEELREYWRAKNARH